MAIVIIQIGRHRAGFVLDESTTVGRLRQCGLWLDARGVSRRHAQFDVVNDQWTVSDLGSTNGTAVNNHRIEGPYVLEDGDLIAIGPVRLTYLQRSDLPTGLSPSQHPGEPLSPVEADAASESSIDHDSFDLQALAERRSAKRQAALRRREAAAKARRAAAVASRFSAPAHISPGAAGAQCALSTILPKPSPAQDAEQESSDGTVVWRYLSTDAKPVDKWATDRTIATDSHFTPHCQPLTDEQLIADDPHHADYDAGAMPDDDPAVADASMGDLFLLLSCFIAFPLGLITWGLPNVAVIFMAWIYKATRRKRFSNGMFALIIALSLVGLVAGAFRAAQGWLGIVTATS